MILEVKNLSKSYYFESEVINILENINLEIKKTTSISIMGPSGSGKTTLLSILAGLEPTTSGEVIIGNTSIQNLNEEKLCILRQNIIGFIFQNSELIDELTVIENIQLPLLINKNRVDNEKITRILKELGLNHRAYNTPKTLSGGEKQRVAIARSLIHDPEIIFADEPTGNLDEVTAMNVMKILLNLVKKYNKTLIIITHNPIIADMTERSYVLKNKQLDVIK